MENANKIRTFTQLIVWQKGHGLVLEIYKITKNFPKEELFGLTSQLRRAIVSITSNIAEGFSRASYKDKAHFYNMALGSLTEVQNQLLIGRDLGYIKSEEFKQLADQTIEVQKMLTVLIKNSTLKA
ncbi:MAG: four helix bundle protein [Candidatus Doudnabacteria bacterium]|jgi:four helix bundle protein